MQAIGQYDVSTAQYASALTLDDSPGLAVKASEGLLWGWHIINTTAAVAYVQFFNVAAVGNVTLGTTAPDFVVGLAANGVSTVQMAKPVYFSTGIVVFATTTPTGNTAAAQNAVFFYS